MDERIAKFKTRYEQARANNQPTMIISTEEAGLIVDLLWLLDKIIKAVNSGGSK